MRKSWMASLGAAGVLAVAGSAGAATIVIDLSGTIASGVDSYGLFGAAGSDVAGSPFDAIFTFDTTLGARKGLPGGGLIYGGPRVDPGNGNGPYLVSTPGQADLVIGGATVHFDGNTSAISKDTSSSGVDMLALTDGVITPGLNDRLIFDIIGSPLIPAGFAGNFGAIDPCAGAYECVAQFIEGGVPFNLDLSSLTYTITGDVGDFPPVTPIGGGSGVPEPGPWALMIVGFGLAGASLRRRRALA